jgi:hypothetical protein
VRKHFQTQWSRGEFRLARPVFAEPPQSAERNCSVFHVLAKVFVGTIKCDYVRVSSCRMQRPSPAQGTRVSMTYRVFRTNR